MTDGKSSPAILLILSLLHFRWGDRVNWLFFIWILYAGFVFYLAMGPYCPFRN